MTALYHLTFIWLAVLVSTIIARKTRLTPVLYFLAMGSILVNIGVLPIHPEPFIEGFAEIGIIVIMFALGFEEETGNFVASLKKSWGIAFFGALVPFLIAYAVAYHYWSNPDLALMVGLTMTATAVSLTMVSLKSEGLNNTPAATRIMTSAVLDDIASLTLVAILVPVAAGEATLSVLGVSLIAGKALAFMLLVSILGMWIFPHKLQGRLTRIPILGRFGIRDLLSYDEGEHATLLVLILALVVGLTAHYFGFHPAVGAYMAGLVLKKEYFHRRSSKDTYENTRQIIDSVAYTWMGPVFFVLLGSKLVLDWEIVKAVIPQTIVLLVLVSIGQVISAAVAARFTGGMKWPGSILIGFGMLGRAELAFVVMNIAYVQYSIINTEAFYMLMFTIFWMNVAVAVAIRMWKPVYQRSLAADHRARKGSHTS